MSIRAYKNKKVREYMDEETVMCSNHPKPMVWWSRFSANKRMYDKIELWTWFVMDLLFYVKDGKYVKYLDSFPCFVNTRSVLDYIYSHCEDVFFWRLDNNPEIFEKWGVYKNEKYRRRGTKNQRWQENRSDLDYNPQNVTAFTKKLRLWRKPSKLLPDVWDK